MKKLIAVLLLVSMLFACAAFAEESTGLNDAKSYLYFMYKNKPETTMTDYTVVGNVVIGENVYEVVWTADSDTVKFVRGEDSMVTVDVDEKNPEEVIYHLTATVSDETGSASVTFTHRVPAAMILGSDMSYAEIVDLAYTLEDGLALEDSYRLFGTVSAINTPWSDEYKNITVTIQVEGKEDKPVQCYRLAGDGCETLAVGDQITVEGILKNYKGTIEYDKGCQLIGKGEVISQSAILDAAYALEDGVAMTAPTALEGVIVSIDTPWSEDYKNITVTIVCDGKEEQKIQCYRLCGEGCEALAVGDQIGVAGTIKNYKGTIEFDKACKLIPFGAANDVRVAMNAFTLEESAAMTEASTLTGTVIAINTAWSDEYKNITVTMNVAGLEEYPVQCYRLAGEGAQNIQIGDTITVNGIIKNYKGTIEFDKGCQLLALTAAE